MNHTNYASVLAFAIMLAGCSTPGELRNESAAQTFASVKDAKTVATCVIDGFEEVFKTAGVSGKPTETGYTVSVGVGVAFGKDTAVVVDIANTASGSITTFYSKMLWGDGKVTKVLNKCRV